MRAERIGENSQIGDCRQEPVARQHILVHLARSHLPPHMQRPLPQRQPQPLSVSQPLDWPRRRQLMTELQD